MLSERKGLQVDHCALSRLALHSLDFSTDRQCTYTITSEVLQEYLFCLSDFPTCDPPEK